MHFGQVHLLDDLGNQLIQPIIDAVGTNGCATGTRQERGSLRRLAVQRKPAKDGAPGYFEISRNLRDLPGSILCLIDSTDGFLAALGQRPLGIRGSANDGLAGGLQANCPGVARSGPRRKLHEFVHWQGSRTMTDPADSTLTMATRWSPASARALDTTGKTSHRHFLAGQRERSDTLKACKCKVVPIERAVYCGMCRASDSASQRGEFGIAFEIKRLGHPLGAK